MRSILVPTVVTAAALALAACGHQPPGRKLAAAGPAFDAATFFDGRTEGVGTLHRVLRRPKQTVVRGTGRYVDGRLLLTQQILIQDEPPTRRTFDLHRVAPGQWRGTITDGTGPVTMVSDRNAVHIRYPTNTGFSVDQWLYLQPDGRTALNRMSIRSFGAEWGKVEETIRHVD